MNIFHCCVHKSGSQWITDMLSDPWLRNWSQSKPGYLYPWTDITPENPYQDDFKTIAPEGFPGNCVISPLYCGWNNFQSLPKVGDYKAFFVMRHPKDILVSTYYSVTQTHYPLPSIQEAIRILSNKTKDFSIKYHMSLYLEIGLMQALTDWWSSGTEKDIHVVRYEDLIGEHKIEIFYQLFHHCQIDIPRDVTGQYLQSFTLEKMRERHPNPAHFRKGIAGSWVDDWSPDIEKFWAEQPFFQSPQFKSLPYDDL